MTKAFATIARNAPHVLQVLNRDADARAPDQAPWRPLPCATNVNVTNENGIPTNLMTRADGYGNPTSYGTGFLDVERAIAELSAAIEQEVAGGALDTRIVAEEAGCDEPSVHQPHGRLQSRTQGRVRVVERARADPRRGVGRHALTGFVEHGTSRNRPTPTSAPAWRR